MKTILFWTKYNGEQSESEWVNTNVHLSPFHYLSLSSHLKFGNEVYLYSYQKISGAPAGVVLLDASEIYDSLLAFSALERGHSIAHISDLVRLRAASEKSGIVMDMDAISLRPMPDESGSFFTSLPAKMTGGFAPQWGDNHPPLTVHDGSWDGKALSNFPVKLCPMTKSDASDLIITIAESLSKEPKSGSKAWNYVMWALKGIAKRNKEAKTFQPLHFGPLPGWLKPGKCYSIESPTRLDGCTELFGYRLPSIDEIFSETYVVQHFFESASQNAPQVDEWFWVVLPYDCLLAMEAEHILGQNWRMILTQKQKKQNNENKQQNKPHISCADLPD